MDIVSFNYSNPDPATVKKVAEIIKAGGIVVVPTETVYGILGSALNKKTVKKIVQLKKRNEKKGFDLTLYPPEKIFDYAETNSLVPEIIEEFSEQPLSLALPRKKSLPDFLNPDLKTVAFHFFFSKLDEELFKYIDVPLIGTSANISNLPDTGSVEKVVDYFKNTFDRPLKPDLVLDSGKLKKRNPSAVIEILDKKIRIVRGGDLTDKVWRKRLEKIGKEKFIIENNL
ncbi:MAG TPA: L-threonylcarbamoyladenylate synthase [Candidatus Moranbacteria bacterium]|nr:L-threonylcarbamoyladenylate synthase [Candidatus Moranbacteria bacterium]